MWKTGSTRRRFSLSVHPQKAVKRSQTGQANVKQRVFCVPAGQEHNPGGNKTQADHVGPVNVICKVLITTWRLCEAGSQLSRQRRPDLLPKQHGPGPGDSPGNEIFSLLTLPFERAALNKLRAVRMLFVWSPFSSGAGGRSRRSCVVYCHSCEGLTVCVFTTHKLSQMTLNENALYTAVGPTQQRDAMSAELHH